MKNKKGFMLTETLVVSTLVSVVLVSLYVQFSTVVSNFNKSYKNDNVNDLYAVYYISNLFKKTPNLYDTLKSEVDSKLNIDKKYIEINTNCDSSNSSIFTLSTAQNCSALASISNFYDLNNKGRIIFMRADVPVTDADLSGLDDYNFSNYIKSIRRDNVTQSDYRLIVKFDNLEYANLVVVE